MKRIPLSWIVASMMAVCVSAVSYADQWTVPTKEELEMKAQPEVPGAAAVYLFREQTTEDSLHMRSFYSRIKVLTEEGKKYGDVQLSFVKGSGDSSGFTVTEVSGRTIQPDGTIVPFTGKPYEKMIEKSRDAKYMAKIFSLPAVQVGSILEYRYKMRWDDNVFFSPDWYPQEDLYTRKAHYLWKPTDKQLISHENGHETITNSIAWVPVLPPGPKLVSVRSPSGQQIFELTISDVKPLPDEEYMPPISNFSYRVLFYYTAYSSAQEYWKSEGKYWSSSMDRFIGPGSGVKALVAKTVAPGDTQEQKLQKLYAEVMKIENTSYTRQRTSAEDRHAIKSTDDVLNAGHGYNDEITRLFVAMARAAGMKAYLMRVTNRDRNMFIAAYLSLGQLVDDIAIVEVDGKERFFDPGSRYCPFGHLDWMHTATQGLRQSDKGAFIGSTPREDHKFSGLDRIADLKLDESGVASGTVTLRAHGQHALEWRHRALRGDETSLHQELRRYVESIVPEGMEVKVTSVDSLTDFEKPLIAKFSLQGPVGKSTSTRLLVPGDLFLAKERPAFVSERRETGVYFEYPDMVQDAFRIAYPGRFTLESSPKESKDMFDQRMAYDIHSKQTGNTVTVWRNLVRGDVYFEAKDYPGLRSFYTKLENEDKDVIVLKAAGVPVTASGAPGN